MPAVVSANEIKLKNKLKPLFFFCIYFFMRLLHEQRQDSCLLSLNVVICLNENFPICICFNHIKKIYSPPFFLFLAAPVEVSFQLSCNNTKCPNFLTLSISVYSPKVTQVLKTPLLKYHLPVYEFSLLNKFDRAKNWLTLL